MPAYVTLQLCGLATAIIVITIIMLTKMSDADSLEKETTYVVVGIIGGALAVALIFSGLVAQRSNLRTQQLHKEMVVEYPNVTFTRNSSSDNYVEFRQDNLRCNGLVGKLDGKHVIRHGTVDCFDISQNNSKEHDSTPEDLNSEMQANLNYHKTQLDPYADWLVLAGNN